MTHADYAMQLILSVILIVGGYQFYFWCQRHPLGPPREFRFALDRRVPYWPSWVWIYSLLYYPAILYVNWVVASSREFVYLAGSFLGLLAMQMACFVLFPVATPESWRRINRRRTWSERFLEFVQRLDARSNSFPSMHTSVAMLTALHLQPHLGAWVYLFPVLIGLSCLFTKQHLCRGPAGGRGAGVAGASRLRARLSEPPCRPGPTTAGAGGRVELRLENARVSAHSG